MVLRACRTMCSTELGYDTTRLLHDARYRTRLCYFALVWSSARLCCYALAMHCSVLRRRMLLRACYAISGTQIAYAPTRLGLQVRSSARYPPTRLLCGVRY
eukprot:2995391-Rhodomonas_salina.1